MTEQLLPDQVILLCNHSYLNLRYVSANAREILGYSSREFQALSLQEFFHAIHPEDVQAFQQCVNYINKLGEFDPAGYRFVFYYRFLHKSGQYFQLRDEKLAIKTKAGDNIYLSLMKNESSGKGYLKVRVDLYKIQEGGGYVKNSTFQPSPVTGLELTPRQQDIVNLIGKGYSDREIADHLQVSISTIKNHKQVLFRKVSVKSSLELLHALQINSPVAYSHSTGLIPQRSVPLT